ncbi:MAG: DNA-binding protein [Brasilonema sp.]
MPTSDSYYDDLISRLKDPSYAALYLETHMELDENEEQKPELMRLALSYVAQALSEQHMTPEQAKLHLDKLNKLLSQRGVEAIYNLENWLNALGLKLTVIVDKKADDAMTHAVDSSELIV